MNNQLTNLTSGVFRRIVLSALGLFASALLASAQFESGVLAGKVTDSATGTPLSGAIVRIDSLLLETSSDRSGEFFFPFVSPGPQSVNVSYLGLPAKDFPVTILKDGRATLEAKLGDETIVLEAFTVTGQKAGQARALNEQRASGNLRTIVSSDALGRFPDQNAAETMQRITGVSLERDQGEGRFISIRGVDPDLNNTQLNGVNVPASQGDTRKVNLDVFPADILDSIEVVKAVTPDMDGDAIGGSVNIKTQNAFSSDDRILRASAETGYSDLVDEWGYKFGAVWGDKFKKDTIGLLVAFSSGKRSFGSNTFETDDDPWVLRNGFLVPDSDVQVREYNITRWRKGASFSLDFKPNSDNSLFVRGVYSHFSDREFRYRTRFRGVASSTTGTSNTTGTVAGRRVVVDLKDRYEDNDVWSLSAGGEHRRNEWNVDYLVAFARAELVEPFGFAPSFRSSNTTWNFDFSDPLRPKFSGTGANLAPTALSFDEWTVDKSKNLEDETTVAVNVKRALRLGGRDASIKVGAKYRGKERSVDANSDVLELASGTLTLANFPRTSTRGPSATFPSIDDVAFRTFYGANPTRFTTDVDASLLNATIEDYDAEENILAGYAMGDIAFGKFTLITGVRAEQTDYTTTGWSVEDEDVTTLARTNASRDYTTVLPGVITRYDFSKRVIGRASCTTTLARPKPLDASTSRSVEDDDVTRGNPNLKPYKSNNLDASVEFYPQSLGVISVGAFHKDITDFIYEETILGGGNNGGSLTTPLNGDSATVTGVEADWQQQLTFLPSPFDGLGFYANATLTDSESQLGGDRRGEKVPFLNQSKKIFNVALSYEKYGFFVRASLNHRSRYLTQLGEDRAGDLYAEDHTQVDITTNYKFSARFLVYAEFLNVTEEPFVVLFNESKRLRQAEFYSWSANVGVKVTF